MRLFVVLMALFILSSGFSAAADDAPDELYRKGAFAEALKAYGEMDMNHPQRFEYRYNRGCAAYKNGDWKGAAAAFSSVLKRSGDPELRFRAAFNLGNARYRLGDYQGAKESFEQALALMPHDAAARKNLEVVVRELEKQKREAEKQRNDEQKQGDEQDSLQDDQQTGHKGDDREQQKSGIGDDKKRDSASSEGGAAPDEQSMQKGGDGNSNSDDNGEMSENAKQDEQKDNDEDALKRDGNGRDDKASMAGESDGNRSAFNGQENEVPSGKLSAAGGVDGSGVGHQDVSRNESSAAIDKKKAEAMLDNVIEKSAGAFFNKDGGSSGAGGKRW